MDKLSARFLIEKFDLTRAALSVLLTAFFIIISIFIIASLVIIIPIWLCVQLIAKVLRPDLGPIVSGVSATFTIYSQEECNHGSLNHYLFLDGVIAVEKFREIWNERVLCATKPNGELLFPLFRYGWTHFLGYPFWKPEKQFSLEWHIQNYNFKGELELPVPCYEADIQRVMARWASRLYNADHSPWQVLLIQNFRVPEDRRIRTVLLFRHHHALIDGYGLVSLMRSLLQTKYSLPQIKYPNVPLWQRLLAPLRMSFDTAEMVLDTSDGLSGWHPDPFKAVELESCMSDLIPISKVKSIKSKLKVSYSAVVFAVLAGAIERATRESKMRVPCSIGAHYPIPKPNHPGGSVNHMYIIGSRWAVAARSREERVKSIQRSLKKMAESTLSMSALCASHGISLFPTWFVHAFMVPLFARGSIIVSSFPATTDEIYLDSIKVRQMYTSLGAAFGNPGMAVMITGCNGDQRAVVTWNKNLFPNSRFRYLGAYIDEELDKLASI